ncbi:MAG: hypothetical protein AAF391_11400, partial [Bacteroidota bacterium]
MTTGSDMNVATDIIGGLSSLTENPEARTVFSVGSFITGIFGGIFSSTEAEARIKATEEFRKHVLKELTQINNKLTHIESTLGSIDTELKKIYHTLNEANNISIAKQLGLIDTAWENFAAYDPSEQSSIEKIESYASAAFAPANSVLSAMNTINEVLTSQVFNGGALEGELSIAGYMYLKSKLIQGLYILGYASSYTKGRDFGSYVLTWSQNFADHMKAIIAYGKKNPKEVGPYTAHFDVR